MGKRIYLASSWRNQNQEALVHTLRDHGHQVYDFKNPPHGRGGFSWQEIDHDWENWSDAKHVNALLDSPVAAQGYLSDYRGMEWADTFVMAMPCGRSAHLELGWAAGRGKQTIILLDGPQEPELMYLMADSIVTSTWELLCILEL